MRPIGRSKKGMLAAGLIATYASVLALPAFALTDELPIESGRDSEPPPHAWSGWSIGASAGHSWGDADVRYAQGPYGLFGAGTVTYDSAFSATSDLAQRGGNGGLRVGYDYQRDRVVLGLITDIEYRNSGNKAASDRLTEDRNDFLSVSTSQRWLGTLRGRIGFAPWSRWLVFASAGLSYGEVRHSTVQSFAFDPKQSTNLQRSIMDSPIKVGWTAGGGVEYGLNGGWSVAAEYLYVDLGLDTQEVGYSGGDSGKGFDFTFPPTRVTTKNSASVGRISFNYKFDGL